MVRAGLRSYLRAACCVLACTLASSQALNGSQTPAGGLRILFVGDSFTFRNGGVAKAVSAILAADAGRNVTAVQYALSSHTWAQDVADAQNSSTALYYDLGPGGNAQWDFVVFQERSVLPALSGRDFSESQAALLTLSKLAVARGAKVALTLTWGWFRGNPSYTNTRDYTEMQDAVTRGYISYAAVLSNNGIPASINPVGLAWQLVRTRSLQNAPDLPAGASTFQDLYNPADYFHPSIYGTTLESAVIAAALTGCSVRSTAADPLNVGLPWMRFIKAIANEVVFGDISRTLPPYPWTHLENRGCPTRNA